MIKVIYIHTNGKEVTVTYGDRETAENAVNEIMALDMRVETVKFVEVEP